MIVTLKGDNDDNAGVKGVNSNYTHSIHRPSPNEGVDRKENTAEKIAKNHRFKSLLMICLKSNPNELHYYR